MFQMDRESRRLAAAIEGAQGLIVVLTGAGISLASGIPTFRGSDPGAIWARDITELATLRYFTSDPVGRGAGTASASCASSPRVRIRPIGQSPRSSDGMRDVDATSCW